MLLLAAAYGIAVQFSLKCSHQVCEVIKACSCLSGLTTQSALFVSELGALVVHFIIILILCYLSQRRSAMITPQSTKPALPFLSFLPSLGWRWSIFKNIMWLLPSVTLWTFPSRSRRGFQIAKTLVKRAFRRIRSGIALAVQCKVTLVFTYTFGDCCFGDFWWLLTVDGTHFYYQCRKCSS